MEIEHFSHDHTLKLIQEDDELLCNGCRRGLSGLSYGCTKCSFYLHKVCAELPQVVQHFFHPCTLTLKISNSYSCDACFKSCSGFTFRCEECEFDLDVECALLPNRKSECETQIHFTHGHPLILLETNVDGVPDTCSFCSKLCSGPTYGCNQCKFFLHKSCLDIPRNINHFFHSCPLLLHPKLSFHCEACKENRQGLTFYCRKCNFHLDVECALLPTSEHEQILHFGHGHPLQLLDEKVANEVHCKACREQCFRPSYGCRRCNTFYLHKSCADLPQEIQHPFHPQHPLTLIPEHQPFRFFEALGGSLVNCNACGGACKDFTYKCNKCSFILAPNCAELKPSIKYKGHLHLLTFIEEAHGQFSCSLCHKRCKTSFLRCVECNFNLHMRCHPSMQRTIKHKCHIDPLTYTKLPIQDDSDEFYCDACEERRNQEAPVYYCAECNFPAHIRCVISKVFPSVAEDEDAELAEIDIEIAELHAEVDPLEEESDKLKGERGRLQQEREQLKEKLEEVAVDTEALTARIEPLTAEIEQVTEKIKAFENELSQYLASAALNTTIDYSSETSVLDGSEIGASVNFLPYTVVEKLSLGELQPTSITLQLADRSIKRPRGILEDVLVKVGEFILPADFIVLDLEECLMPLALPIILARPFIRTADTIRI